MLTLCRAWHLITEGRQVPAQRCPLCVDGPAPVAALIDWAHDWSYAGGDDEEDSRLVDTTRFVNDISSRILTR